MAQWINGEKLSQSKANDVSSLVNLGVITYLTQLLDTGFFHADPRKHMHYIHTYIHTYIYSISIVVHSMIVFFISYTFTL